MKDGLNGCTTMAGVKGFTVMEVMMVIAIVGILLMLATPSVNSMIDKQRVRGTCESIYQNLALARSSAASLNKNVIFNFRSSNLGATWCVGLSDGATPCDCSTAVSACKVNGIQRSDSSSEFGNSNTILVAGMSNNTSVTFSARDMTPNIVPPKLTVTSNYWACALQVEPLGQVRYLKTGSGTQVRNIVPVSEMGGLY